MDKFAGLKSTEIDCPYCGVSFTTSVDCTAGDQTYTEDCHICCQPIEFVTQVSDNFELQSLDVRKENE